jgi:hypothetical protein
MLLALAADRSTSALAIDVSGRNLITMKLGRDRLGLCHLARILFGERSAQDRYASVSGGGAEGIDTKWTSHLPPRRNKLAHRKSRDELHPIADILVPLALAACRRPRG